MLKRPGTGRILVVPKVVMWAVAVLALATLLMTLMVLTMLKMRRPEYLMTVVLMVAANVTAGLTVLGC